MSRVIRDEWLSRVIRDERVMGGIGGGRVVSVVRKEASVGKRRAGEVGGEWETGVVGCWGV